MDGAGDPVAHGKLSSLMTGPPSTLAGAAERPTVILFSKKSEPTPLYKAPLNPET